VPPPPSAVGEESSDSEIEQIRLKKAAKKLRAAGGQVASARRVAEQSHRVELLPRRNDYDERSDDDDDEDDDDDYGGERPVIHRVKRRRGSSSETPPATSKKVRAPARRVASCGQKPAVVISTIGWRERGCSYKRNFGKLVQGKGGVLEKMNEEGKESQDWFFDCKPLKTDKNRSLLGHTGNHYDIMESVGNHEEFDSIAAEFVRGLEAHFKIGKAPPYRAMLVSTSGCHRSVAMGNILKAYCEKVGHMATIEHLSERSWGTRGLCVSCSKCGPSRQKDKMIWWKVLEMMV
jgi:hypothetical protein